MGLLNAFGGGNGLAAGAGGAMAGMGQGALMGLLPLLMQGGGGGGLMGAFSGNPQFQQQLGSLMNGQGPGSQPVQFTPPITQMTNAAPMQRPSGGGGRGGLMGLLNNINPDLPPWWQRQAQAG